MLNHSLFFNCAQLSDNKFYCLSLKQTCYLKRKPTVISSGVAKGGLGVVNPQQVPSPRSPPLDSHQVKNVHKYIMILHLIINPHEMVEPPPSPPLPPPKKKFWLCHWLSYFTTESTRELPCFKNSVRHGCRQKLLRCIGTRLNHVTTKGGGGEEGV